MTDKRLSESIRPCNLILYLEFIENLNPELEFPLKFNLKTKMCNLSTSDNNIKIELSNSSGKIDLSTILDFPPDGLPTTAEIVANPLLIFFEPLANFELSFRTTVSKDESKVMWISVVDLLPLAYGNEVVGRYPMHCVIIDVDGKMMSLSDSWTSTSIPKIAHLLPDVFLKTSVRTTSAWPYPPPDNILTVTLHALYNPLSLTRSSQKRTSDQQKETAYLAVLDLPPTTDSDEKNTATVFAKGSYSDIAADDSNEVRWRCLLHEDIPVTVSTTGQRFGEQEPTLTNTSGIPQVNDVFNRGSRYVWNSQHRFSMSTKVSLALQEYIFKYSVWPMVLISNSSSAISMNTSSESVSQYLSSSPPEDALIAFLDLSSLMTPNCTSVRCISSINSVNVKKSLSLLLHDIDLSQYTENVSKLTSKLHSSTDCDRKEWTTPFIVVDISTAQSLHMQYLKQITYEMSNLGFNFNAKTPSVVNFTLAEEECQRNIRTAMQTIIKATCAYDCQKNNDSVETCVKVLKAIGEYDSLVSSLQKDIKSYVEKKYKSPRIGESVQSFVNRISADLADKTKNVAESFEFPHSYSSKDSLQLKKKQVVLYAKEAYECKQMERAEAFYKHLIRTTGTRCDSDYWLLYATFCSGRLDFDTALECVKEVLLDDSGSWIGLFLYAAIQMSLGKDENNRNGETALKALIMYRGDLNEPYVLLSVYYDLLKMPNASLAMLQKANKISPIANIEEHQIHDIFLSWKPIGYNGDPLIKCTILLLKYELIQIAKYCLRNSKQNIEEYFYYMAVCEYKSDNFIASLDWLKTCETFISPKNKKNVDALKCLNDIELKNQSCTLETFILSFDRVHNVTKEDHLIYLKSAQLYFREGFYTRAAEICLVACTVLRTPMLLCLLGKSLIKIGLVEIAKKVLSEANLMDNKNEEIWKELSLINIKLENTKQMNICYNETH
ncbi:uncharacterized protein LOC126896802 [Daktulosphaira vitifoliae]|uniref:uncharacterized protein LOC126896802 n=1 Tax=Daktulosphaira vitifoliae TaxID=58002 RepID=UPI0021A9FA38|nr:uncharacterized protein LOC126896802 [Daktulosphaira vitifoliae]